MTVSVDLFKAAPEISQAFLTFSQQAAASGLEQSLIELVKIRASQINHCANCLNMHTYEARQAGETEQRLHLLAAWHEAPCYSARERAALAWTDHLTLIADKGAPARDLRTELATQFSEEEQVKLTMMINAINVWNRLAVGFGLFAAGLGWKQ